MYFSLWKMWARTNTEKKAREVLSRLLKKMGPSGMIVSVEPEEKEGYLVSFRIELESEGWNDAIIECFCLGQQVASGWCLLGSIQDDPGGFSNHVSDSGVETLEWSLRPKKD